MSAFIADLKDSIDRPLPATSPRHTGTFASLTAPKSLISNMDLGSQGRQDCSGAAFRLMYCLFKTSAAENSSN